MCVLYHKDPQFCAKSPSSQARQAASANSIGHFSCFFFQRHSLLRETAGLASSAGGLSQRHRPFQLFKIKDSPILRETASLASSAGGLSQLDRAFQLFFFRKDPQFCAKPPASQARQAALANSIGRFSFFKLKTKPNFARNRQPRKLGTRPWPTQSPISEMCVLYHKTLKFARNRQPRNLGRPP